MTAIDEDRTLKQRHRAMWASGDYPAVVDELVAPLGPRLVAACGVGPGERVLDIAAGTGNAAIPAAVAGATVTASDLTPELFDAGHRRAAEHGATLDWQVADAEALPFPDAAFDVVLSCIGVMFAPHHEAAADELLRVCGPGGRIGLLSWTPGGFVGQMFATMRPYLPPPPPGVQPPPKWGDEGHVRGLLGDRVAGLSTTVGRLRVDRFATGAAFRDYFKANYGPTIAAYRGIADDPDRSAALDQELAELGDDSLHDGVMQWEYMIASAERR